MISKITSQLIDKFILELKKKDNMNKVKDNVIDPLIYYSISRIYPYLIICSIIFILTFILSIFTLILIIKSSYEYSKIKPIYYPSINV